MTALYKTNSKSHQSPFSTLKSVISPGFMWHSNIGIELYMIPGDKLQRQPKLLQVSFETTAGSMSHNGLIYHSISEQRD